MMKKLCLLLALLLIFALCGCESNLGLDDKDEDDDPAITLTAEEALEEALQALTGRESNGYAVLLGADGQSAVPQHSGIALLLSSYVTFDVKEVSSKGDTATAKVEISAPDSASLLQQATEQLETVEEEALYTQLEALLKADPAMVDYTVDVQLVQAHGSWCVVPDFALSNALTGGLTQAYMELQQMLLTQLMEGGAAE